MDGEDSKRVLGFRYKSDLGKKEWWPAVLEVGSSKLAELLKCWIEQLTTFVLTHCILSSIPTKVIFVFHPFGVDKKEY